MTVSASMVGVMLNFSHQPDTAAKVIARRHSAVTKTSNGALRQALSMDRNLPLTKRDNIRLIFFWGADSRARPGMDRPWPLKWAGKMTRDSTRETRSTGIITPGICKNKLPISPGTKHMGKNASMVVVTQKATRGG